MAVARRQLNATLLPDGTVLVTGGTSKNMFNVADDTASLVHYRRALESGDRTVEHDADATRHDARQELGRSLAFTTLVHCCCPMRES